MLDPQHIPIVGARRQKRPVFLAQKQRLFMEAGDGHTPLAGWFLSWKILIKLWSKICENDPGVNVYINVGFPWPKEIDDSAIENGDFPHLCEYTLG